MANLNMQVIKGPLTGFNSSRFLDLSVARHGRDLQLRD